MTVPDVERIRAREQLDAAAGRASVNAAREELARRRRYFAGGETTPEEEYQWIQEQRCIGRERRPRA